MGAITASVIGSVCVCRFNSGRLDMEVIMNATLAGGVSIGSASSLIGGPWWAMLVGLGAGAISALGFIKLGPYLQGKIALYDTCGIHNLHGMPGVFGGICGAFACLWSDKLLTNTADLYNAMPARAPADDGTAGRTAGDQAGVQIMVLAITLGIAISTGAITGWIASKCGSVEGVYHDKEHWDHVDKDEVEIVEKKGSSLIPRRSSLVEDGEIGNKNDMN